jgi:hypothetical protein
MAIVSKFLAMLAPNRRPEKRLIDAGDFTNMVVFNRELLDMKKLRRLAGNALPRGGAKIKAFLDDIDAGRQIHPSLD